MRLAKTDTVAGIPAPAARTFLRRLGHHEWYREGAESVLAGLGVTDPAGTVDRFVEDGLLNPKADRDGDRLVEVTLKGSAAAMASFGSPITRATADNLLAGLLSRAAAYNEDPDKPLFVRRLRVFGSYLDPAVDRLGDVDIEVRLVRRAGLSDTEIVSYGKRSGRSFRSYLEQLTWPDREAMLILKNRSTALNLTPQDIDEITERSLVVFEAEQKA